MKAELFATAFLAASAAAASACAEPPAITPQAPVSVGANPAPLVATLPAGPRAQTVGPCCVVKGGAVVTIELTELVSSENKKRGDSFRLKLAAPVTVDGQIVIPAGAEGVGEVVDAAAAGIAGRPAKLVLAARALDHNGMRVPLRAFRLAGSGADRVTGAIIADELIGVVGLLAVTGGKVVYPVGTRALAKIAADTNLPPTSASPAPPALLSSQPKPGNQP